LSPRTGAYVKIAIVTEVDALPGGSQTPGTYERN
jgi:hypothetical protein